jgi:hypothetical protein
MSPRGLSGSNLQTFTLDTNCIIAIENENEEPDNARAILRLVELHRRGLADVAVVAMMASENPRSNTHVGSFDDFLLRLERSGLSRLRIILPLAYWGVSFWGQALWSDADGAALERNLHAILFPTLQFDYRDYCAANGLDAGQPRSNNRRDKWLNAKCDVQTIWSHIHHRRDVFVADDGRFHRATKKPALLALGAGEIVKPPGTSKFFA